MRKNPFENFLKYRRSYFRFCTVSQAWHSLIVLSILASLSVFLAELLFHFSHSTEHWLIFIEVTALSVLGVDLFMEFVAAKDKFVFFKKNWLLILAIIPLARVLEVGSSMRFLRLFRVGAHTTQLVEAESLMGMTLLNRVQQGVKAGVHGKHLYEKAKKGNQVKITKNSGGRNIRVTKKQK